MSTPPELPVVPAAAEPLDVVAVRHGMFGVDDSGDTSGYGGLVQPVVLPAAATPPYGGWFDDAVAVLRQQLPEYDEAVSKIVIHTDDLTFHVRREHLVGFAQVLRDAPELRFEMCLGVSGLHWPDEAGAELHALYPFLSITHNRRVFVDVSCPDADPHIPSLYPVYPANDWHERETYDFFGIIFDGHPSLTRIEMPDDWPGHPQRKDYPLGGIPVEYKGAEVPPPDERRGYYS